MKISKIFLNSILCGYFSAYLLKNLEKSCENINNIAKILNYL